MYLRTLEICVLNYKNSILQNFHSAPGLAPQATFKKAKIKLHLFTDIDVLLRVETGIRRGICYSIY